MIKKIKTIRDRDEIVFFPTPAFWNEEQQTWDIEIAGALFDPMKVKMRKKLMVRLLRRFMKVPLAELDTDVFRDRIRPFTANALRGRTIEIRMGSMNFELQKRTKRNGHFSSQIQMTSEQIALLVEEGAVTNRVLKFRCVLDEMDQRVIEGRSHLLLPEGQSVISDVDDTIKFTDVGHRIELLKNTFLREFTPIQGMSELYRKWSREGADFHFVSASPWQLINPLLALMDHEQFPVGTFSLRNFRWRDPVLRRVLSEKWIGKSKVIRRIVKRYPQRNYVLIGDSAERDPELYAHLAEEFSDQIRAIFIRQVPGFEMTDARVARLRRQLSGTEFSTFESVSDLPRQLGAVRG